MKLLALVVHFDEPPYSDFYKSSGCVQEPAALLPVRMRDSLHFLTARERRGHLSQNGIEKPHRIPAGQSTLPPLVYNVAFGLRLLLAYHL
jgi:hypothetical protein